MKLLVFCLSFFAFSTFIFSADDVQDLDVVNVVTDSSGTRRASTPIPESHSQAFARTLNAKNYVAHVATLQILEHQEAVIASPFKLEEQKIRAAQELQASISEVAQPATLMMKPATPVSQKRLTPSDSATSDSPELAVKKVYSHTPANDPLKKIVVSSCERIKNWFECGCCCTCCN